MNEPADPRLERLLGGERLAALRKRLRQRYERAPVAGAVERIRVGLLAPDEHAALAALIGRPPRLSASLQLDVPAIDAALQRAGISASLRDALETLDGPIVHLASARDARRTAWSAVIEGCRHPALRAFAEAPSGIGLVKRLARQDAAAGARLCRRADVVLQRLPAGGLPRAQLAAETLGDAHALDRGRPTASLVLAAWRLAAPLAVSPEAAEGDDAPDDTPANEERVRDLWARAGVAVNELARPALYLNLPRPGDHASGEPAYVSLRVLLRAPPDWKVAGRTVYVCENPNLLAIAADALGARCAPIACTEGMPAAAQRCLLLQLVQAGAQLRYHGDFDWPGLRIGQHVMSEFGALPWRFGAPDYAAAVEAAPGEGQPLQGSEAPAPWDAELAQAMRRHLLAIAEEAVAGSLLHDLDRQAF